MIDGGHQPFLFPTLEVSKTVTTPKRDQYDVIIFISANAVEHGVATLRTIRYSKILAVGAATAKKLSDYGVSVDDFPKENASSEALLALDSISQLQASNVLIFRGKGGRETLRIGLEKNNNHVEYAEVYDRVICSLTPTHQNSLGAFISNKKGAISITSNENLEGLVALSDQLGQLQRLKTYPLIVLSERIKKYALLLGFSQVLVTQDISDQAIVAVLENIDTLDK